LIVHNHPKEDGNLANVVKLMTNVASTVVKIALPANRILVTDILAKDTLDTFASLTIAEAAIVIGSIEKVKKLNVQENLSFNILVQL